MASPVRSGQVFRASSVGQVLMSGGLLLRQAVAWGAQSCPTGRGADLCIRIQVNPPIVTLRPLP
jgi:hypothetical protein